MPIPEKNNITFNAYRTLGLTPGVASDIAVSIDLQVATWRKYAESGIGDGKNCRAMMRMYQHAADVWSDATLWLYSDEYAEYLESKSEVTK